MKITIKVLKGQDCTLDVALTDTILAIKQQIEKTLQIPLATQKLLYLGRTLSDENTVSSYRIQENSKLNLIVASKPQDLQATYKTALYKSFRKHFDDAQAERLSREFMAIFNAKLKQMSLDDIERLSEQLTHL